MRRNRTARAATMAVALTSLALAACSAGSPAASTATMRWERSGVVMAITR